MRSEFEKLTASSPSYLKLVFQHGERLFIFEDGQYKIAAVQLAWELEQHNQGRVDELQKRIDSALKLIPSLKSENDLWGCEQVERQIELLEQALKGESND